VSLFKKIIRGAGKIVGKAAGFIPGPVGAVARIGTVVAGAAGASKALSKGLPAVRSLPGVGAIGKAVPRIGGKVLAGAGTAATGVAVYDAVGNYMGQRKKSRRINPLNHRALKRAIRRIERSKDIMKRVGAITIRKEKC
jgi:hypothetical protein